MEEESGVNWLEFWNASSSSSFSNYDPRKEHENKLKGWQKKLLQVENDIDIVNNKKEGFEGREKVAVKGLNTDVINGKIRYYPYAIGLSYQEHNDLNAFALARLRLKKSNLLKNIAKSEKEIREIDEARAKQKLANNGGVKPSVSAESPTNAHDAHSLRGALSRVMDNTFGEGWFSRLESTGKFKAISHAEAANLIGKNAHVEAQHSTHGDVVAFHNPSDATTYFVADNIGRHTSDNRLLGLVMHEVGVHALRLGASDPVFSTLKRQFEQLKASNKQVREAFARVPADTHGSNTTEEAMGYFLEHNPTAPLGKRIVEAFRQMLRKLGNTLKGLEKTKFMQWANKLSEQELRDMAMKALRNAPDSLSHAPLDGAENRAKYSAPADRFYSALKRAFINAPAKMFGNPQQVKQWLASNAAKFDVKKDEIYWSGINDWLDMQEGKVSRDDVDAFLAANGVQVRDVVLGSDKRYPDTWEDRSDDGGESLEERMNALEDIFGDAVWDSNAKHQSLTLPGGKDYKELVVTIPTVEPYNERDDTHFGDVGEGKQVAWLRMNTRTDSEGRGVLFLEEVQSQRGADGRTDGFIDYNAPTNRLRREIKAKMKAMDLKLVTLTKRRIEFRAEAARLHLAGLPATDPKVAFLQNEIDGFSAQIKNIVYELEPLMAQYQQLGVDTRRVPPAPFIADANNKATNAYISLLMKKAISEAIDNKQNVVAWTTGRQQADRYDLSKHCSEVAYVPETGTLAAYDKEGTNVLYQENVPRDKVQNYIGKELADKLLSGEPVKREGKYDSLDLSGDALYIEPAWTQAMYGDNNGLDAQGKPSLVMQAAMEIARKMGGEVGSTTISETGKQPALIITPKMAQKVSDEGMPLFSRHSPAVEEFLNRPNQLTRVMQADTMVNKVRQFMDNFSSETLAAKIVDPSRPLARVLQDKPLYDHVQNLRRADIIWRMNAQSVVNLIQGALRSGHVVKAGSGMLRIDPNSNSQATPAHILETAVTIGKAQGFDGPQVFSELVRILRGEEIIDQDAELRKTAPDYHQKAEEYRARGKESTARKFEAVAKERETLDRNKGMVTGDDIQKAHALLQAVPEFKGLIGLMRENTRNLVDLMHSVGMITPELQATWNSQEYYFPMQVYEDMPTMLDDARQSLDARVGRGAKTMKTIDKAHGHTHQVNFWDNMSRQTAYIVGNAMRNETRNAILQQLVTSGNAHYSANQTGKGTRVLDDGRTVHISEDQVVTYVDGKKSYWTVPEPALYDTFNEFHHVLSPIMQLFGGMTNVLRTTALVMPSYWFKQLTVDPIHATFVSNVGLVTPLHSMKAIVDILLGKSGTEKILQRHGALGNVHTTFNRNDLIASIGHALKPQPSGIAKLGHALYRVHGSVDSATRVAVYDKAFKRATQAGMGAAEAENLAAMKAVEAMNFAVHGNSATLNTVRHMVPFFSAALTGLDSLYRACKGHNLNPEEKARTQSNFLAAAGIMALSTSIYTLLMLRDKNYKDVKALDKDNNWLIPLPDDAMGNHNFARVPVPYETGFLLKTFPEVLMRYMMHDASTKEFLKSLADGLMRNLPPMTPVGQAFNPMLDIMHNHNPLTGRPIESLNDQRVDKGLRGAATASELAMFMSNDLALKHINLSPVQIDWLIKGYFAEWGSIGTGLASALIKGLEGKDSTPTKDWMHERGNPLHAFTTDPTSTRGMAQLYDLLQSTDEVVNTVHALRKQGKGGEAREYMADPDRKKLVGVRSQIRNMADAEAAIRQNIARLADRPDTPMNRKAIAMQQEKARRIAQNADKLAHKAGLK